MMMKVDGVDDGAATALRQAIVAAGADYAGTVTLHRPPRRWPRRPTSAPCRPCSAESTLDPTVLRADLAARLGTLVTSVADSRPGDRPPATAAEHRAIPPPRPPRLPPTGSQLASIQLRSCLGDLDDAGFVKLSDQPDDAATARPRRRCGSS